MKKDREKDIIDLLDEVIVRLDAIGNMIYVELVNKKDEKEETSNIKLNDDQ